MPCILHVAHLVGEMRTVSVEKLRNIVDLSTKGVVEVDAQGESVDVEGILETSINEGVGTSKINQVVLVKNTVIIYIQILAVTY